MPPLRFRRPDEEIDESLLASMRLIMARSNLPLSDDMREATARWFTKQLKQELEQKKIVLVDGTNFA